MEPPEDAAAAGARSRRPGGGVRKRIADGRAGSGATRTHRVGSGERPDRTDHTRGPRTGRLEPRRPALSRAHVAGHPFLGSARGRREPRPRELHRPGGLALLHAGRRGDGRGAAGRGARRSRRARRRRSCGHGPGHLVSARGLGAIRNAHRRQRRVLHGPVPPAGAGRPDRGRDRRGARRSGHGGTVGRVRRDRELRGDDAGRTESVPRHRQGTPADERAHFHAHRQRAGSRGSARYLRVARCSVRQRRDRTHGRAGRPRGHGPPAAGRARRLRGIRSTWRGARKRTGTRCR